MKTKHTIKIWLCGQSWMSTHSDPSIKQSMGTANIQTAFTSLAKLADVVAKIQSLNPDALVIA